MIAVIALLLAAPALRAEVPQDAAAVVDGHAIPLSLYREERSEDRGQDPLDYLITTQLLAEQGEREKLTVSADELDAAEKEVRAKLKGVAPFKAMLERRKLDEKAFRAELEPRVLARKVVELDVRGKLPAPTDAELRAYFERIQDYIAHPDEANRMGLDDDGFQALRAEAARVQAFSSERVRISRILIRVSYDATPAERKAALDKARDIEWVLGRGESFAEVAKAKSEDAKTAARGGDAGFFLRGALSPELAAKAFSMEVGDVSEPIPTHAGYEILRLTAKRSAEKPDFERFKEDLARSLRATAFDKAYAAFIKGLYAKAEIERRPGL